MEHKISFLVSVVIPVYNDVAKFEATLGSVLCQTYSNLEVIVVDDGSTEDIKPVLKNIRDERVSYHRLEHKNANVARNYGVAKSCGQYVAMLDADDLWAVNHVEQCLSDMVKSDADGSYGGLIIRRQVGDSVVHAALPRENESMVSYLLRMGYGAQTSTLFMTAASAKDIAWDEDLYRHQDYDFVVRYGKKYKWAARETETVIFNGVKTVKQKIDFASCIKFIERNKHDITPDIYRHYHQGMLRLAKALSAEPYVVKHYAKESAGMLAVPTTPQLTPQLTIIIPFLNEGDELQKTLQSIKDTATGNPHIILINDSSTDGYDYQSLAVAFGCAYLYHSKRIGVAASRDEGVALCKTPYFLLLDAHMEFYEQGWDERVIDILNANPRSLLCSRTGTISSARGAKPAMAPTFGAYFDNEKPCGISISWNRQDPNPNELLVEIPCVLGAAYAMSKDYWERLHGLRGLVNYGLDESLISLKVWCEGGKCLLLKDWLVGHLYRKSAPYAISGRDMTYNEIFILRLFFTGINREERLLKLQKRNVAAFGVAYEQIKQNADFLEKERSYLWSIFAPDAEQKLTALCGKL
jgi:glycosyltransferase involved in cell wall biosynthesis